MSVTQKQIANKLGVSRPARRRQWGSSFTLIELLVVDTVISVLLALLMPVLRSAKEAAMGIKCMNNIRQLGMANILYAGDNRGWAPYAYFPTTSMAWYNLLLNGGYVQPLVTGRESILICPGQRPRDFASVPGGAGYTYGMRWSPYGGAAVQENRFRILISPVIDQAGVDWGKTSSFLHMGDSVLNFPGNAADRYPRYYFPAVPSGSFTNSVHLRHNNQRGNFLFGDGHVQSLSRTDLVGSYGNSLGLDKFDNGAIDTSRPNLK